MLRIILIALTTLALFAGTWTEHNFIYKPSLGAQGQAQKEAFDAGLDRVDAHLGTRKTLGDPGYCTLAEALTTIGSEVVTLFIPAGTVTIAEDITIPANVHVKVLRGGVFQVSDGVTLTVNGPFEAGPYQVFNLSGTGKADLSEAKVGVGYTDWWGGDLQQAWASGIGDAANNIILDTAGAGDIYYNLGSASQFRMSSEGDFQVAAAGKGLVLSNPVGSIMKRVRLNDEGGGLILEGLTPDDPPAQDDPAEKIFLEFDGKAGDHLLLDGLLGESNTMGLALMVRCTANPHGPSNLIDIGHSLHGTVASTGGTLRTRVWPKVGGSWAEISDDPDNHLFDDNDHLIVITIKDGEQKLYIDNQEVASNNKSGNLTWDETGQTRLFAKLNASDGTTVEWHLSGRFYWGFALSRALTSQERDDIWNDGAPQFVVPATGRLAMWPVSAGSGDLVEDTSGNGYHLTYVGTPKWHKGEAATIEPPTEAPTITLASKNDTSITWGLAHHTTTQSPQSFEVETRPAGGETTPDRTSSSSYTLSGLGAETTHELRARSVNSTGEGPWSDWDARTTLEAPPVAANPLRLEPQDLGNWDPVARPASLHHETLYREFNVGPGEAPAPEPLPASYTEVTNFSELQAAVNKARPGETIVLRAPNYWTIYNGELQINVSGTAGNEIIIRKHPDDPGEAWLFPGWMNFVESGVGAWEVYNADLHIWRSKATGFSASNVFGHLVDSDTGRKIYLFPYLAEHFFSTSFGEPGYRGPGCIVSGGRVYIRLQDPSPGSSMGTFTPVADKNPNNHRIFIAGDSRHAIRDLTSGSSHLRFWDLSCIGSGVAYMSWAPGDKTNIRFLRCAFHTAGSAFSFRYNNITDIWVEYCALRTHWPQWLDRREHKSTTRGYRNITFNVAFSLAAGDGHMEDIHIRHCRMTDFTDGPWGNGQVIYNSDVQNCYIRVIDDTTQINAATYGVEFGRNHIVGIGPGWATGSGPTYPGDFWIHHNVVDLRWRMLIIYGTMRYTRGFNTTHGDISIGHPWKIYNNTVIGSGFQTCQMRYRDRGSPNTTGVPHYIMNNIIIQTDWITPPATSDTWGCWGAIDNDDRVAEGSTIRDGNLYFKTNLNHGSLHFIAARWHINDQTWRSWQSVQAFKDDTAIKNGLTWFQATQQYYAPGWEAKGDWGDPEFVNWDECNLQPAARGRAALHDVVDLTAFGTKHGWNKAPERDSPYVGAIPPVK